MGNGTKVALVALLILMVVVIARFVRDGSEDGTNGKDAALEKGSGASKTALAGAGGTTSNAAKSGVSDASRAKAPPKSAAGTVSSGSVPAGTVTPGTVPGATAPAFGGISTGSGQHTTSSNPPNNAGGTAVAGPGPSPGATPPSSTGSQPPSHASERPSPLPGGVASSPGNTQVSPPAGSSGGAEHGERGDPAKGVVAPPPYVSSPSGGAKSLGGFAPITPGESKPPVTTALGDGKSNPGQPRPLTSPGTEKSQPTPPKPPMMVDPAPPTPRSTAPDGAGRGAIPATYVVEKGDSYWGIAQKYYKDGKLGAQIEKANPGVKLIPGKQITLPQITVVAKETLRRPADDSAPAPSRKDPPRVSGGAKATAPGAESVEHVVQKGDTLSSIAKRYYKDASKFHLIEDANDDLKYQTLRVGMRIKIPPAR